MKRLIELSLVEWAQSPQRRPLLLGGARQVGKTYILKEFGVKHFPKLHVFNFEEDKQLASIFEEDFKIPRILEELSFSCGEQIDSAHDLILFDEIQECPRALTALKYFHEKRPEQALCCAGSLIGVKLSQESFPVGQVDYLWLGPLRFSEFLKGIGDEKGFQAFTNLKTRATGSQIVHQHLWARLKEYYVTGGMPAVVRVYQEHMADKLRAFDEVRRLQAALVRDYSSDFAKHSGKINSVHIQGVFENIPRQLSHYTDGSVKRYRFKDAIANKKGFSELAGPIQWLIQAGLAIQVDICNKAEIPLATFTQDNRFKLYMFDIGILGCMLQIPPASLIQQDYGSTKGYFAENLVAQALTHSDHEPLYAWNEGKAEIEFLKTDQDRIIPIEVKSGLRTKAKSLHVFKQKYNPDHVIKCTAHPLVRDTTSRQLSVPLYMVECIRHMKWRNE